MTIFAPTPAEVRAVARSTWRDRRGHGRDTALDVPPFSSVDDVLRAMDASASASCDSVVVMSGAASDPLLGIPNLIAYYDPGYSPAVVMDADATHVTSLAVRACSASYLASSLTVAQSLLSNKPVLTAASATMNGRTTLSWSGVTAQKLQSTPWANQSSVNTPLAQPYTLLGAFRSTTTTLGVVCDGQNSSNESPYIDVNSGGSNRIRMYAGTSLQATGFSTQNVVIVFCAVYNGASSALYANAITTPVASGAAGALSAVGFTIGNAAAGGGPLSGETGKFAFYAGVLSAADRATGMNALGAYYGQTIAP